jgi:hypothetical protein
VCGHRTISVRRGSRCSTRQASTSTGALAGRAVEPDILWVGTGESNIFRSSYTGVGVYKSTDNAKTFQHMGLTDTGTIGRIVIHPTDRTPSTSRPQARSGWRTRCAASSRRPTAAARDDGAQDQREDRA